MIEFKPPIAERTTEQLLSIIGSPENWNESAVNQASNELTKREIPENRIKHAKYLSKKLLKIEELKRAKEAYSVGDFIDSPFLTFLEILISWELKRNGFIRKAEQQKWFRLIFILLIIGIFLFSILTAR